MGVVNYSSLFNTLRQRLSGNSARLKVLTDLIVALLKTRSVNLVHLVTHSELSGAQHIIYRRLQCFFAHWNLPQSLLAQFILSRISKPKNGYVLSIDRTNWQFGQQHINILTIGIVIDKVAVPLVWRTLPQASKRGNSNTTHRIELVSKLLNVLPAKDISFLAMDREFCGQQRLKWLDEQDITFVLRLKLNTLVGKYLAKEHSRSKRDRQAIFGMLLYFGRKVVNTQRTEILYVVSNHLKPKKALRAYLQRWSIEVVFGYLKKKGLNLEDTHMSQSEKIDRLVTVCTLALPFSFKWGMLLKAHFNDSIYYQRKSNFRLGLESFIRLIRNEKSVRA